MSPWFYIFLLSILTISFFIFQKSPEELLFPNKSYEHLFTPITDLVIKGSVVHGLGKAKDIGFPTANLNISNPHLPVEFSTGFYLGKARIKDNNSLALNNYQYHSSIYQKEYKAYFRLNPTRDVVFIYFPDLPSNTDLYNKEITLNDIYRIDSHWLDFSHTYHTFLDQLHQTNYIRNFYK